MKKVLFVLIIFIFNCLACAENNTPQATIETEAGNTETVSKALSINGVSITCTTNEDCATYAEPDDCIFGAVCHSGVCDALIYDSCCILPEGGKDRVCLGDRSCGNNEECDDGDSCTHDTCNPYLFEGTCTHGMPTYYQDADGDGFGNPEITQNQCEPDDGFVSDKTDCDDSQSCVNPIATEDCDNLDNDCDGNIDEDLIQETTCGGLGQCAGNTGYEMCSAGEWINDTCDPFAGESDEVCDGLDNDCDGNTDEDLGETSCGLGECYHTIQNCVDGETKTCDEFEDAGEEVCDGLDNDCDGTADEGDACAPCNNPWAVLACGDVIIDVETSGDSWLNGYSLKPAYNESGPEVMFTYTSETGGVKPTFRPINIDPTGTDFDIFVLTNGCDPSTNIWWGNTSATFTANPGQTYKIVVDGYSGGFGFFDMQVTCKETNCTDSLDNDNDDSTDCADPDCYNLPGVCPT